jgi:hypothetical protein
MAKEQSSACVARPIVTEVRSNRLAGGSGQWHGAQSMTLTPNPDGTDIPVEIIKLQASYLNGAQSQVMQAAQDRVVAPADGVGPLAGQQHRRTLGRGE